MPENRAQIMQWVVTVLLLSFPVVALVVHDAGNAIVFVLLILSVLALALRWYPEGTSFSALFKSYWPLYLAMASACVAVFLNQAWNGSFAFKFYDRGLRLAVFPLIFWVLFFVPNRNLKLLQWSFMAATLVAMVKAYVFTEGGTFRDGNIGYLSIIAYSDITLLTGVLCLTSFGWNDSNNRALLLLKVLVCMVGVYVSILTATRGSLVALPFFLAFFMFFARMKFGHKWFWSCLIIVVLALMLSLSDTARTRFLNTKSELAEYSQDVDKATSTGIRLQLWGAALKLFARQPVFGIGRENYEPAIKEMADKKEVTKQLTTLAHSHNEILFNMAISGIFGLISILAIYFVPGYYFARELKSALPHVQTAARMGCVLAIAFFVFGLTDLMFFWTTIGGYYTLMVSAILVCVIKEKQAAALRVTAA